MAHAMELVASSKMRRATERMIRAKNYSGAMEELFSGLDMAECRNSVFVGEREEKRVCVIVIAGDRGLAGGYNSNIFKCEKSLCADMDVSVFPIGKRACEYYLRHGYSMAGEGYAFVEKFDSKSCFKMACELTERFCRGEYDALYVVYTRYDSVLSQTAVSKKLLPIEYKKSFGGAGAVFEPDSETVMAAAMPEYISAIVYGAVCESFTSELACRRNAMNSAGKNASEIIDKLSLEYNRARQGAITQEITEIVAGSQS